MPRQAIDPTGFVQTLHYTYLSLTATATNEMLNGDARLSRHDFPDSFDVFLYQRF